ncbi:MAG: DUF2760 domain-containing protein [Bryobacterales bacterium]|nr:DUF2760 domain-containing protein [Bryobacterales bacterium]MBV9399548.1 DUF2760 domain-containing protein [Bryobacterales bacterium]
MNRLLFAFRSFFSILFTNSLAPDIAQAFGYSRPVAVKVPTAPPKPVAGPADGAVQMLAVLQRDARLIDFLMEDISGYPDDQVGAAVRDVQAQARESLGRYLQLEPVIDSVEGTFTKADGLDTSQVKFLGNVPATGKAPGGVLRHRGWKAAKVDLPQAAPGALLAPAELEVE